MIYKVGLGYGLRNDDLDDIVSSTYLHIFSNIEKYDPTFNVTLSTFIGAVSDQCVKNYLLAKKREKAHKQESLPKIHRAQESPLTPYEQLVLKELRQRMADEPDNQMRTILRQRFIEDMTLSEIADAVSMSIEGVRQRIVRWINQEKLHLAVA